MSQLQLPILFSSHMMLQRNKPVPIEGTVRDAALIRAEIGIQSESGDRICLHSVQASAENGRFRLTLPGQDAGSGFYLRFYEDGQKDPCLELSDISIGDIWMACGQSNMEYFLRYDANWNETRRLPRNRSIRMFNVPRIAFDGQKKNQPECGYWFEEGDEAWPAFSAPGYSFARTLQPEIDVPVGVIGCNWGGTPACAWMGEEYCKEAPLSVFREEYEQALSLYAPEELQRLSETALAFENSFRHELEWRAVMYGLTLTEQELWLKEHEGDPVLPMGPWHHYRPFGLYHTMIRKTAPFPVKGFLWYQGESDTGHADYYDQTMDALVRCFRDAWNDPDLPFLFVQLAPFGKWLECTNDNYAKVRAAQERASKQIPHAWMASIMDLGSFEDIHPKFKMEVGRRLALLALGHVYGKDILCDPPSLADAERIIPADTGSGRDQRLTPSGKNTDSAVIQLFFRDTGTGLVCDDLVREGFQIRQEGRLLSICSCHAVKDCVTLTLAGIDPQSRAPLEISYAEEDFCETHLWNSAGLCMKPFHTSLSV